MRESMANPLLWPLLIALVLVGCAETDSEDERCRGVGIEDNGRTCRWQEVFTCDVGPDWCAYDYPVGTDGVANTTCTCAPRTPDSPSYSWHCQQDECRPAD